MSRSAHREIVLPHGELADPQTITGRNIRAFEEAGLDIHVHEVDEVIDDQQRGVRILKVRNVKYFDMGRRSG